MTLANSDRTSVIAVSSYLLKVTKRTFQQKVHFSVTCFKKVSLDLSRYRLEW